MQQEGDLVTMLSSFARWQMFKPALLASLVSAFVFLFLFASCTSHPLVVIPEGKQTLTGVLLPVQISLSRRGTHALIQSNVEVALVESSTVNLRQMEGVDIVVVGHFERNTDPEALPVLVASGVTLVDLNMRTWKLSAMGLTVEVPPEWNPKFLTDGVRFSATGSSVYLAVSTGALSPLPASNRMTVGGRPAAFVTSSGASTLSIHNGSSMILFEFAESIPGGNALMMRIIRTILFATPSSFSPVMSTSSGASPTPDGAPCGGAAGLLCPTGSYCEVTDTITNIGRCRSLKR